MAQRVEIGNRAPADIMRMGIQINLPMPPSNNNGGMYEKTLEMTCPGRQKVM
jgi:hypothetical protein